VRAAALGAALEGGSASGPCPPPLALTQGRRARAPVSVTQTLLKPRRSFCSSSVATVSLGPATDGLLTKPGVCSLAHLTIATCSSTVLL
jgi:hypothetical protein